MNDTTRLAVVTASASGIGLKTAEALVRDGFRVVMSDIDTETGEREATRLGSEFRPCDARDDSQVIDLFEGLGTVYALINNVGVAGPTAPVWELGVDDFRTTMEINVTSHLVAAQQAIPGMMAAREGVIINLSSVAGTIGFVNRAPYAASKWAVRGLSKTLANELGPYNIRVNAIMPGAVDGPRIERVIAASAQARGVSNEHARASFLRRQAIEQFVDPADIAELIAFLVSDRGKTISGGEFHNDGAFE